MSPNNSSERTLKTQPTPSSYPDLASHEEKVLIVVKTYPHPSKKYKEIVCTAGITENGKWIRLYPIDYRYLEHAKWYKKYQWITVTIEKNQTDFRVDSYRPDTLSIKTLGDPIDTRKKWGARKSLVLPTITFNSLEEIQDAYKASSVSLGIFKPKIIEDLVVEADSEDWSASHTKVLSQLVLFGDQPKKLYKVPYKFSYVYRCNDKRCTKPHKQAIFDWEIFMLYQHLRNEYNYSMDVVLQKIKDLWLTKMWGDSRNSYLIVGTQFPNPTFIVLGVFWPPK
ncbi:hypothetical protein HY087_00315 [Candidatus Gottesmanbacteria bacterium]|nr:hypothetical protein [Candidatus Gottesmanbacteria bacterium]